MEGDEDTVYLSLLLRRAQCIEVEYNDSERFEVPYTFLRDSCRNCFDKKSGQRLDVPSQDRVPVPSEAGIVWDNGFSYLLIIWENGTESMFEASWLYQKCRSAWPHSNIQSSNFKNPAHRWGSEMSNQVPSFNFRDLAADGRPIYSLLQTILKRQGIALIRSVPARTTILREVAKTLTNDPTLKRPYQITTDIREGGMQLRTESCFCEEDPGILLLYCARARPPQNESEMEDSTVPDEKVAIVLVDGQRLNDRIKELDPLSHSVLCSTGVSYRRKGMISGNLVDWRACHPVFCLDYLGQMRRITLDERHRSRWEGDPQAAAGFLQAYQSMLALAYSSEMVATQLVSTGQVLVMDASRILWEQAGELGATSFQCALVGRDDALNRMHLLGRTVPVARKEPT